MDLGPATPGATGVEAAIDLGAHGLAAPLKVIVAATGPAGERPLPHGSLAPAAQAPTDGTGRVRVRDTRALYGSALTDW